jgi:hypothetical protein
MHNNKQHNTARLRHQRLGLMAVGKPTVEMWVGAPGGVRKGREGKELLKSSSSQLPLRFSNKFGLLPLRFEFASR